VREVNNQNREEKETSQIFSHIFVIAENMSFRLSFQRIKKQITVTLYINTFQKPSFYAKVEHDSDVN
jgi:hypothetical protein